MGASPAAESSSDMQALTTTTTPKPGLKFLDEETEQPPFTEKSEAQRRRERGILGSRASLVIPKGGGGVGTNVPS